MFDENMGSRFRYNWDTRTITVNGEFEAYFRSGAENQQLLAYAACIGGGDWISSPFNDGRDEDNVRAVTQKTATLTNRKLTTVRIATRNNGREVRIEER